MRSLNEHKFIRVLSQCQISIESLPLACFFRDVLNKLTIVEANALGFVKYEEIVIFIDDTR